MTLPWHRQPMLAFDLETTGKDPNTARIVTATLVEVGREGIVRTCEWLVDPGVEIPAEAAAIHGITTEQAREDGRPADEAVFEITGQLGLWLGRGRPVVAFNAAYDFTVLDRECIRQGVDPLSLRLTDVGPIIDPYVMDKHCHPYRKGSRVLSAMCTHYDVKLEDAHTSIGDALGAARLAFALAQRFPDDLQRPLADLHRLQRLWRAEQQASLGRYFAKQGNHEPVNGEWPVQSIPDAWTPALFDLADAQEAATA